jgi:hypothetical protein
MKNSARLALFAFACLIFGSVSVEAQNTITTVAGGGPTTVAPGVTATSFSVGAPAAVKKDIPGNTYILDNAFGRVYKIDTTGKLTLFAGNGTVGFSGEAGPATAAAMNGPSGLCIDSQNNVYVADSDNAVIREIVVTAAAGKTVGNIYTVAGQHETSFSWGGDGDVATANTVHLHFPDGCAFDSKGNMYIADRGNNEIRVVIGEGFSATPGLPVGVTGTAGHIYLFAGSTGTVAPGPPAGGYGVNGAAAVGAGVYGPFDVFVDSQDNVFYADLGNNFPDGGAPNSDHTIPFNNNVIREVPATAQTVPFAMAAGAVYTVAGVPGLAGVGHTTSTTGNPVVATAALLQQPRGISVDAGGNLFFADNGNQVIREVPIGTANGMTAGDIYDVVGVAGSRGFVGEGVAADTASLNFPAGTFVGSTGNLFIADQTNDRVREVVPTGGAVYSTGTITTFAGNGSTSFGVGSTPTVSQMNIVEGVAVDPKTGDLIVADVGILSDDQSVIRGVPPPIATSGLGLYLGVAGNNNFSNTAPILVNNALNMTFDKAGNAYIADTGNCIIRKFSGSAITTIAGVEPTTPDPSHPEATVPQCGAGSSGGVATATKLGFGTDTSVTPTAILGASGVAVDSHGNVFFSDAVNNVVYEVPAAPSADGTKLAGHAYVIAGSTAGFSGDGGAAAGAQFNRPQGLYIDIYDNLYIADSKNNVIREIPAVTVTTPVPMTAGNIYTVAGKQSAGAGYSGNNGLATNAQLNNPFMIAVDNALSIFIADTNNHVIRQVAGIGVTGETQGNIYLVTGNNVPGFKGDGGPASGGQVNQPKGLAIDASGNLLIGDSQNLRVRSVATIANVAPVALASLSPNPVTLTTVVGTPSTASVVTLTNGGGAVLMVTGVSIVGTDAADFTKTENCTSPGTVAAGGTCTINVIFNPAAGASTARTATLTVADTAFGGSQSVTLNGTVGNPVLTLAIAPATAGDASQTVTAGATASYNLSVTANQAVTATITCTNAPTDATCTPAPASVVLTANTAGTLKVSVTTTARGEMLPFNQPSIKMQPPSFLQIAPMASLALLFVVAMMLGWMQNQPGRMRLARVALSLCLILMPIAAATVLVGCGGGSSTGPPTPPPATGTPAGTYMITVTATSGSTTNSTKLTLIVN